MDHFREILGEERFNEILQYIEGLTYEELLRDRNRLKARVEELEARVEELEEENQILQEALEESQECEDPVLRAHKRFGEFITPLLDPKSINTRQVEREHREGIPFDECDIQEM